MLQFKISAQNDQLDQYEQKAESDGELPKSQRKIQTEHIRDGGDGRGSDNVLFFP